MSTLTVNVVLKCYVFTIINKISNYFEYDL